MGNGALRKAKRIPFSVIALPLAGIPFEIGDKLGHEIHPLADPRGKFIHPWCKRSQIARVHEGLIFSMFPPTHGYWPKYIAFSSER